MQNDKEKYYQFELSKEKTLIVSIIRSYRGRIFVIDKEHPEFMYIATIEQLKPIL